MNLIKDCFTHLVEMLHDVLDDVTACIQIGTDSDHTTGCIRLFVDVFESFLMDGKQEENVGKLRNC